MPSSASLPLVATRDARRSRPHILVYEPNLVLLDFIQKILGDLYSLQLFSEEAPLVQELAATQTADMLLLAWDGVSQSLALYQRVLPLAKAAPIVLLSCTADTQEVELVMRMGARGFVLKPFNGRDLQAITEKHLAPGAQQIAADRDEAQEIPIGENRHFVRSSKRMRDIESQAALVARSDIPVLILGESGTGKEVVAMFVHKMSARAKNMFLKVNCAAMPADLLESELFGYEQGAFTGAIKTKPGKFETCSGGTIFLDEIGEMPAALQAKLLQVLQDGTFSRLGSRAMMKADVRVIAATNINMREAMAQKTFREDLYYRLNGFSLHLPALRERAEEIRLLASYFMRRGAEKYGRAPLPFSPVLVNALTHYPWPGNLRELENVVNRYLILGDERSILADLGGGMRETPGTASAGEPLDEQGLKQLVRSLKGDAEAVAITSALEETGWNRKAAAANLKISYKALLYKIKNYNLSPRRP